MAGTGFRNCPVCGERSRDNRVWWCPFCDYNKPKRMVWDVEPLRLSPKVVNKLRKVKPEVAAKIQRKLDEDKLGKDIARFDRTKLPKLNLRPKAGLRRS